MSSDDADLGLVAAGVGFPSLAFQLGDYSSKLVRLLRHAKLAPDKVKAIESDLEMMAMALQQIELFRREASQNIDISEYLKQCQLQTAEIETLVDDMDTRLSRYEKIPGTDYAALKEQDIVDLLTGLERSKTTLMMVHSICDRLSHRKLQAQSDVAAVQSRLSVKSRRKGNTQDWIRLRVKLPTWFYSRVWDISLGVSKSGWTTVLQTYNQVGRDSPVVMACKKGDLVQLRELVNSGQASPLDLTTHYFGWPMNLLEIAAERGNVKICEYLLNETTYPDHSRVMSVALGSSFRTSRKSSQQREDMYRLFFQDDRFEPDVSSERPNPCWLEFCETPECFRIIWESFPLGLESKLPVTKNELCFHLYFMKPAQFLSCLGLHQSDPELSSLSSPQGFTILHYIAIQLRFYNPKDISNIEQESDKEDCTWTDIAVSALGHGSDPHAVLLEESSFHRVRFRRGYTPLMALLSSIGVEQVAGCVQIWARMLQHAGIDLCRYAEREIKHWKSEGFLPSPIWNAACLQLTGLRYGTCRRDWGLMVAENIVVPIFQLEQAPGGFQIDSRVPSKIFWNPDDEHGDLQGHWVLKEKRHVFSIERHLHHQDKLSRDPIDDLVQSHQDDTGFLSLLQERSARRRPYAKRSRSQPPHVSRREKDYYMRRDYHDAKNAKWLGDFHLCPRDMKWNIGCTLDWRSDGYFGAHRDESSVYDLRSCVQGFHGGVDIREEVGWECWSFLSEAKRCRDGHRLDIKPRDKRHTFSIDCPEGCGKFDINRLNVPPELKRSQPRAKNELSEFGVYDANKIHPWLC